MLPIQRKVIAYNKSLRGYKIEYIVIHDTANPGATALNHYNYFNGGDRQASADFFVDSNNIIQLVNSDTHYTWHVGDGKGTYGITNSNSIGIEMCLEKDGMYSKETLNNTIELTLHLMSKYNIPADKVVRHYDASRKMCPNTMSKDNWKAWNEFKKAISGEGDSIPVKPQGGTYMSKVYKNGSTPEPVYSDSTLKNKIGSLDPYEKCTCIAEINGKAIVLYKINGTSNYKSGFVKYVGGIQK